MNGRGRRTGRSAAIVTSLLVVLVLLFAGPFGQAASASGKDGSGSSNSGSGSSNSGRDRPRDADDDTDGSSVPSTPSQPTNPTTPNPSTPNSSTPIVSTPSNPGSTPTVPNQPGSTPPTTIGQRTSPPTRQRRETTCGKAKLKVELASDGRLIELRTDVSSSSKQPWDATIVRDRTLVWKGAVERGRIRRSFPDLPGAEVIVVRLSDRKGTVCSSSVQLPG
jgi:hypothetical protein